MFNHIFEDSSDTLHGEIIVRIYFYGVLGMEGDDALVQGDIYRNEGEMKTFG